MRKNNFRSTIHAAKSRRAYIDESFLFIFDQSTPNIVPRESVKNFIYEITKLIFSFSSFNSTFCTFFSEISLSLIFWNYFNISKTFLKLVYDDNLVLFCLINYMENPSMTLHHFLLYVSTCYKCRFGSKTQKK